MKFCPQCGRENNADSCFCQHCGRPIPMVKLSNEMVSPLLPAVETEAHPKKRKGLLIGIIAIITVVILAGAALIIWLSLSDKDMEDQQDHVSSNLDDQQDTGPVLIKGQGQSSPEDVAEIYLDAYYHNREAETFLYLISEDVVSCYLAEDEWDLMIEEGNQMLDKTLNKMLEHPDVTKEIFESIEYKVGKVNYYSGDDLREVQTKYEEKYGIKIDNAATVNVELQMEVNGQVSKGTNDLRVVQMNGQWYTYYAELARIDLHCFERGFVRKGE